MPETAEQKKKREHDDMLAALRGNQTKVSTAEEGTERNQEEGTGSVYTRRTLKMSGAGPSSSPSPSPSPSSSPSAAGQAKTLRSPGASSYDSMSDADLEKAAGSSVMAGAAWQRRKKAKAGGGQ